MAQEIKAPTIVDKPPKKRRQKRPPSKYEKVIQSAEAVKAYKVHHIMQSLKPNVYSDRHVIWKNTAKSLQKLPMKTLNDLYVLALGKH